jgi:hypothetical protein
MSYDFFLLPRNPGQSWDEVLEARERLALEEDDGPLSPVTQTRLERIADRLQAHDPQLERYTTEQKIELTRADSAGIQVSLFSGELSVTVAYWHTGPTAREVLQIAWSYLVILKEETGWEVYDPQVDRSLDHAHDLYEVISGYANMSARLHRMTPEALRRSSPIRSEPRCSLPPSRPGTFRAHSGHIRSRSAHSN